MTGTPRIIGHFYSSSCWNHGYGEGPEHGSIRKFEMIFKFTRGATLIQRLDKKDVVEGGENKVGNRSAETGPEARRQ